ncbi:large subunit ribosomal protein L5e, cytoplasmic [Guillardia theta CCMP2712]|uniref:Large subunit ribosomal protein L5e, cytoplasmic n=1 Tax=Guillardia theta (strain CCMP2712) TaxID=905079 RepID=L1I3R0_GUITC|nr:large subunit ribosomal protein L5e, cytoplasmic [Guillardia theta CCMP2712]EKX30868.1 large subunit ribosomal protein L5e, cytoplasmic [Guillardia theta CCMP2712]|eukprot:XP_005817848.1 large subunit ribosomal protein L5e, cytoplasmic [Guillardia theta CCMP2712]
MAFVKLVKNNAHFKRYQTKRRRRREGKTDYRARKRLITQDKNKFNTPKYRMIVRTSNRYVYCQIAWATTKGDRILAAACSKELPLKYGLPGAVGLKNWTACYATGFLLARRVLKKLNLDELYKGQEEVSGEDYTVKSNNEGKKDKKSKDPEPFRVCLDVGLQTTSTGARIFGALKGALDGGLDIPHSVRRYPCGDQEDFAETVHEYILGKHVAGYMEHLEEEDPELYKTHFSKYHEADVNAENMEEVWESVYEKIREDPAHVKTEKKLPPKKKIKRAKLCASQRQDRIRQKMESFQKAQADE